MYLVEVHPRWTWCQGGVSQSVAEFRCTEETLGLLANTYSLSDGGEWWWGERFSLRVTPAKKGAATAPEEALSLLARV